MSGKNPEKERNITPAGEVELDEEELDQVTGGFSYAKADTYGYTENDSRGKTGELSKSNFKVEIEGLKRK